MTRSIIAALLVLACGGQSHEDAWTLTPLDPVREAWGSTGGILVAPDGAWCGLVATTSALETLAPLGAPERGASCVVLMPGEHVAFYTRDGGVDWLARQEHIALDANGVCALRCD